MPKKKNRVRVLDGTTVLRFRKAEEGEDFVPMLEVFGRHGMKIPWAYTWDGRGLILALGEGVTDDTVNVCDYKRRR